MPARSNSAAVLNPPSPAERECFHLHIGKCDWCTIYLEQMRTTIRAIGSLSEENINPRAEEELLSVFREWKKSPDQSLPGQYIASRIVNTREHFRPIPLPSTQYSSQLFLREKVRAREQGRRIVRSDLKIDGHLFQVAESEGNVDECYCELCGVERMLTEQMCLWRLGRRGLGRVC